LWHTLEAVAGPASDERPGRGGYRTCVAFGSSWAALKYSRDESGLFERPEAFVELSGAALDEMSPESLLRLVRVLWGIEAKCTRLDAAFDDKSGRITPEKILAEYARPGRFGPFRSWEDHGSATGRSVYFGKRGKEGCGAQFVVYDKSGESGGALEGVRFEARFFKERAEKAFALLCADSGPFGDGGVELDALAKALGELIGGAIEFYDAKGGIPKWWSEIRGFLRLGSPPC